MNVSILRRLSVSDGVSPPGWKFRVIDYVALGFILLAPEELWRHPKVWYSWSGALAAGVICAWFGDAAPAIWTKVVRWWRAPKDLAVALAENENLKQELFQALEKNSELQTPLGALSIPPSLPVRLSKSGIVKPTHNVQCVGFKFIIEEPFRIAALRFQNVPTPGKLMGKFENPRLRVVYYEHSTGQEIADMYPVPWWDDKVGLTDISAYGRNAEIAAYNEEKWTASYDDESLPDQESWQRLKSVELPTGSIRIQAFLSGENSDIPVLTVSGVLALGANGNASFEVL